MRQPPTSLTKEQKRVFIDLPKSGSQMGEICTVLANQIATNFTDKGYSSLTQKHIENNYDKIEIGEVRMGTSYYSEKKIRASFTFDESDGDFSKRLKSFEEEIADYNVWRKENAKEIARVEQIRKNKDQRKIDNKQAALNRQMLALQTKLSKLKAA